MLIANGLLFGLIFGFLLQRAHILRFDRQISMLRLRDMTVLKFMLAAAFSAMLLYQVFESSLLITLPSRPVYIALMGGGGFIFGLGWAVVGYCPGTQLGALGEGRWDALWAVLGGIVGSIIAVMIYPWIGEPLLGAMALESLDIDAALNLSPWIVIAGLGVTFALLCWWLERRGL